MSSKKKPSSGKGKALVAQLGMFSNLSEMENSIYGDDDDDLEDELRRLQAEVNSSSQPAPSRASNLKAPQQTGIKKIPSGLLELDRMVADSMRDLDDDVSDTEDPDLEAELMDLEAGAEDSYEPPAKTVTTPIQSVLQERLALYEAAHSNAVKASDNSKAKRIERGVKTLKDLLKKAQSGKPVSEDDIPPPVALGASTPKAPVVGSSDVPMASTTSSQRPAGPTHKPPEKVNTRVAGPSGVTMATASSQRPAVAPYKPPENLSAQDLEKHRVLTVRQNQFKSAAMEAKNRGDNQNATRYLRTFKQFGSVLKALEGGQPIDLSEMPPPPPGFTAPQVNVTRENIQTSAQIPDEDVPETSPEEKQKLYSAPTTAGSVLEALEQRLAKYKEGEQKAKDEENSSKARRMGRIVKQYQEAIKINKSGKPYAYDDLPTPPGFPPIPMPSQPPAAVSKPPDPVRAGPSNVSQKTAAAKTPSSPSKSPVKPVQRQMSSLSRSEQQTIFLQERQLQFKKAAFKAKTSGDLELAKKYLRQAKGFDQMIEASQSGLPVNMEQIPKPPGVETMGSLEFVKAGDESQGDRDEMYKKLEQDLIQQIRTGTTNAEHFTKLGDVSTATKFDKLCISSRKDLDSLKNAYKHGDPVPRFHYENRTFSMVQSCTDLGDNDLDICIVRGINYNLPSGYKESDLDTYIKYEFPFPKDQPQKGDSSTCKGTNCPEYNESFKVNIERKSRVFKRILESKSVKIDVYYKRGFLKSDKPLGSVSIKLQPLENTCELHDSHDLMDGRKAVGGKLEVKLRVRNPFSGRQVEEVREKWLIIDKFDRNLPASSKNNNSGTSTAKANQNAPVPVPSTIPDVTSMEVLKYEKQLLEQQMRKYQGKLKESEMNSFQHKVVLLEKRIEQVKEQVKKGGASGLRAYADLIEKSQNQYLLEARALVQQGNREKAQLLMTKKKLVEKEVEAIRTKLPPC